MRGQNCGGGGGGGGGGAGGRGGVGVFHIGRLSAEGIHCWGGRGGTKLMFLPFSQVCAIIFL